MDLDQVYARKFNRSELLFLAGLQGRDSGCLPRSRLAAVAGRILEGTPSTILTLLGSIEVGSVVPGGKIPKSAGGGGGLR